MRQASAGQGAGSLGTRSDAAQLPLQRTEPAAPQSPYHEGKRRPVLVPPQCSRPTARTRAPLSSQPAWGLIHPRATGPRRSTLCRCPANERKSRGLLSGGLKQCLGVWLERQLACRGVRSQEGLPAFLGAKATRISEALTLCHRHNTLVSRGRGLKSRRRRNQSSCPRPARPRPPLSVRTGPT